MSGRWRARLLVLGSFAALFAAGVVAGVAWERTRGGETGMRVMVGGARPRVEAFGELKLTGEQRRRVEEIFVRAQPRTDAVLRDALPRLRAVTDSIDREVQAVLTPEQRRQLGNKRMRRLIDLHHGSRH